MLLKNPIEMSRGNFGMRVTAWGLLPMLLIAVGLAAMVAVGDSTQQGTYTAHSVGSQNNWP